MLVTNHIVINLTVGRAQTVVGADVGVLGCIVENDLSGYAGAALFTDVGGRLTGAAAAGLFNVTGEWGGFLQGAGLFNLAGQGFAGVQLEGLFNVCGGTFAGLQAAGLFNSAGDASGAQNRPGERGAENERRPDRARQRLGGRFGFRPGPRQHREKRPP